MSCCRISCFAILNRVIAVLGMNNSTNILDKLDSLKSEIALLESSRTPKPDDVVSLIEAEVSCPRLGTTARHRWNWFHRDSNGIEASGAMFKRAGRVYIHIPKYLCWLMGSADD